MKIDVTHIAKLANLTLSDDEKKKFESQLSNVLSYVEKLQEVETKDVVPTSQVTGLENVIRKDEPHESLPQELALSQAPQTNKHQFQVKGIFEDE
jgi:aspartyl-tRNA(Asn)/glutamyl-tRNA(Gln) amidotransferase subunit C